MRWATNPALRLAQTWYHCVEVLGLRNMVLLPYYDRLDLLASYLQQLVMESLGKRGKGITVYGNKGSTDQHSYVQQLREGYRDFFVTFLQVLVPEKDWCVERNEDGIDVTAGDYLAAFQAGTAQALSDAGRLSIRLRVDRLDEEKLGALIALFERAVGYYGAMLGINPYHQPGVEAGKKAADRLIDIQREVVKAQRDSNSELTPADLVIALRKPRVREYRTIVDRDRELCTKATCR